MSTLFQSQQPVNTGNVANAGYTVPAGRWARVVASIYAEARISASSASVSSSPSLTVESNCMGYSLDTILRSGEVVTTSTSAASATLLTTAGTTTIHWGQTSSSASISIGGVQIAIAIAPVTGSCFSGAAGVSMSATGSASVNYRFEEYLNTF